MEKIKAAVLLPFDENQMELLQKAGGDRVEFVRVDLSMSREERFPFLKDAEIIFGEPGIREIQNCRRLKWIQMSWAGADVYTMREGFPEEILLTNARGCFQTVISEYILAVLLSLCRNLKGYAKNQENCRWERLGSERLLYGKRALILGAGDIGTGTAKKLKAFGVQVTGLRRTDRNYPDCYDRMVTEEQLEAELSLADFVIGCLPDTEKTRGLLDERRLRLLKEDAVLINVGRGSLIQTDALVNVLEEGRFSGVALDVTDPEPLPAEHPLWKFDRVLLTPHVAGLSFGCSRDTEQRVAKLCCQNLERYLNGRELLNRVDFRTGYASE